MELRQVVRSAVDDLRQAGYATDHSRQDVLAALSNALPARAADHQHDARKGPIHLCPWHTCQATRHG